MANLEVTDANLDKYTRMEHFPAKVGDIIGIFAENYTDVTDYGPLDAFVESELTIILSVKPVLLGDLNKDDYVDFRDLALLAQNWLETANMMGDKSGADFIGKDTLTVHATTYHEPPKKKEVMPQKKSPAKKKAIKKDKL